jgi:hypothetical protein
MTTPLHEVCRASLPREALPVLAGLRARSSVHVTLDGERAWVSWTEGDEEVLRCVLPVAGVELYVHRDGRWYRFGHHLPSFGAAPGGETQPLDRVLFPAPVLPLPPPTARLQAVPLRLAPDNRPRQASAGAYALNELTAWAEAVPSKRLGALLAARLGGRVLLLGQRLPPLPGGERFWGERMLVPLGYRAEPALPESAIREALGAAEEEMVVVSGAQGAATETSRHSVLSTQYSVLDPPPAVPSHAQPGKPFLQTLPLRAEVEAIPRAAFEPLTRAGLRLALREAAS